MLCIHCNGTLSQVGQWVYWCRLCGALTKWDNTQLPLRECRQWLIDATLPIELKNNNDGRGRAFYSSAKVRKDVEEALRLLGHTRTPLQCRCDVYVTRILGKKQRMWDPSSGLRGNYKEIEDALVALGWWVDDSPKWIRHVHFRQDPIRRAEPAVRIQACQVWEQNDEQETETAVVL